MIYSKELQKVIDEIQGTPEEAMLSRIILRSMKRADYAPKCIGHFGLAAKYYCHFTSPIRRYPDLQIHRIIKLWLHSQLDEKKADHFRKILPDVTKDCSIYERRADEAERDTDKIKKAEYMRSFIGEEFDGVISGVTSYGFYVELENTVEGLVHVSNLTDDHYHYREESFSLVGEYTKKVYKLGERVKIRVIAADKFSGTVDFIIAD